LRAVSSERIDEIFFREDSMSLRIVPAILALAVSLAFGLLPLNAQPQRPQAPQSLRLYVLDCGIITPANLDNYGSSRTKSPT
jgi:hypothetical protein